MIHRTLRRFRSLIFVLVAPAFCGPLFAIPIRILAWDPDIASRPLAISDTKGNTKIDAMHPTQRTGVYQITGGEVPPAIVALDKKSPEGKLFSTPIKIPEGIKSPLVIILPDTKAPSGVRLFVLEDDTSGFSWGSTRIINAMSKELVYVCEKKVAALPPGWNPVQIEQGGETRNIQVRLFPRDQPTNAVYSAIWEYSTDTRKLVFLLPGEVEGSISIKVVPEDRRIIKADQENARKADKP